MNLVQIAEANTGIAALDDLLTGRTLPVLDRGVDSDLDSWLEVWADQRRVLVYERDLELISLA